MTFDLSLYLVIGPQDCGNDLEKMYKIIEAACGSKNHQPGISLLQYRNKNSLTPDTLADMITQVQKIKEICTPFHIPVLVNDHLPVALATNADGIHVGQSDQSVEEIYHQFKKGHPEKIIGLTVKKPDHIHTAPADYIDYFGIGAVFNTTSKINPEPPLGLDGLAALQQINKRGPNLPAAAIAGITEATTIDSLKTGVNGVAVISEITKASNPQEKAQRMRALTSLHHLQNKNKVTKG